ncbi:Lar family restriction alleviation protein [Xenorhabdus innexi]|uniref:Restriction alleviation protein, Lar family n=1 Tax=Xenorhabdus innexi TaxID=290109 RepID=A0A1N6MWN2_9GAMM|nr:Lar family restriction alleviation protein [Xenorhabdus innexi]PHM33312.1 hypothetical protein Xinn_02569 [Xenorhabdus innexi]SIP73303.1 conserved hypothetical protein [Xenorhabdus innexi]
MANELKPCPFCGSDNVGTEHHYDFADKDYEAWVNCYNCDASGSHACWFDDVGEAYTEAIKVWNQRVENIQPQSK